MTLLDAAVSAPRIRPPRQSLLAVASVETRTDDRFVAGMQWNPEPLREEGSGDLGTWKVDAANTAMSGSSISPFASGSAYGVWAGTHLTTFGMSNDMWESAKERVLRKLQTYESYAVETQLWSDPLGVNPDIKLTSTRATLAGASGGQSIVKSIGILDQAIAATWGYGMVHMRPQALAGAVAAEVVEKNGNVYTTPLGNVVVPGAGYSGLSPAGSGSVGDEFIIATPEVQVLRSGIQVLPNNMSEAVDRTVNTAKIYAMRLYATVWDYSRGSLYARATY